MRWLLDTNVVSETIRPRPNPSVTSWLASQPTELMAISLITLAEIRWGMLSVVDQPRHRDLQEWVETDIQGWFDDRILPLSIDIVTDWLDMSDRLARQGMTRDAADLIIASTARVHRLTVVSRNTRHFAGTGVVVYDPWRGETHRMNMP